MRRILFATHSILVLVAALFRPSAAGIAPAVKAEIACQRALLSGSTALITSTLGSLESCTSGAFQCAQKAPGARARCIAKLAECDRPLGSVAFAQGRAAQDIVKKCSDSKLHPIPLATLTDVDGLGFQNASAECARSGLSLTSLDDLVRCVIGVDTQKAEEMFSIEQARARELLGVADASVPCDIASVVACDGCAFSACVGGPNDDRPCSNASDCPQGACRVPLLGTGSGGKPPSTLKGSQPLIRCTEAATHAGAKFAKVVLQKLGSCIRDTFACVVSNPGASDKCIQDHAAQKCSDAFSAIDAAHQDLQDSVSKKCGSEKIPFDTLRKPYAANLDALFNECVRFGVKVNTLDDYAACIVAQHQCRAAEALTIGAPRATDLLALTSHQLPTCPTEESSLQIITSPRAASPATIGDIVKFVARPFGSSTNSPSSVSPQAKPGGFNTLELVQTGNFFQPRGSTRFAIHYVVGNPGTTLLVRVHDSDDRPVDGFFELPIVDTSTDDTVVIGFQPEIRPCQLRFAFSSADQDGTNTPVVHDQSQAVSPVPPRSGGLEFVELQRNGIDAVKTLECARSVAVSPDSKHVYVTTLGQTLSATEKGNCPGEPAGTGNSIVVFERDVSGGGLHFIQSVQECDAMAPPDCDPAIHGIKHPREAAVSPDGKHVYVVGGDNTEPSIAWFTRASNGLLTFAGNTPLDRSVLDMPFSLDFSPDGIGHYVFAAAGDSKSVGAYLRNPDTGNLTLKDVKRQGDPIGGGAVIASLNGAHSVRLSPDGAYLYVAGQTDDAIAVFSWNSNSETLSFVQSLGHDVPSLHSPLSLAVSPDGKNVYSVGNASDAINVFGRDGGTGKLTFIEVHQDPNKDPDTVTAGRPTFVAVGPQNAGQQIDDEHVYVAGGAGEADDVVSVFVRDPATGRLTLVKGGGGVSTITGIRSLAVSPDDKSLFVTGNQEDALVVFRVVPAQ